MFITEEKQNLGGDSSTNAEEEVVKIPRDGIGQNGEGVVGGATCKLDEEGEEEHVGDGEGGFDSLTKGWVTAAEMLEDDEANEDTGAYPHERQNEICKQKPESSHLERLHDVELCVCTYTPINLPSLLYGCQ